VLEEGEVSAGDEIIKAGEEQERMTIAEINALLYLGDHPREKLEQALRLRALPAGWRSSFEALLQSELAGPGAAGAGAAGTAAIGAGATGKRAMGNAGLAPEAAAHAAAPGFRPLRVARIDRETSDVISLELEPAGGEALGLPMPGQFIVLRLRPESGGPPLYRSYSLSGQPSSERYRLGGKIEPNGRAGTYLSPPAPA